MKAYTEYVIEIEAFDNIFCVYRTKQLFFWVNHRIIHKLDEE